MVFIRLFKQKKGVIMKLDEAYMKLSVTIIVITCLLVATCFAEGLLVSDPIYSHLTTN